MTNGKWTHNWVRGGADDYYKDLRFFCNIDRWSEGTLKKKKAFDCTNWRIMKNQRVLPLHALAFMIVAVRLCK